MPFPRTQRRVRRSSGQSLVEFALVAPLLAVLVFAVLDFGYYLFVTVSVNHATREAVRLASMNNSSTAEIKKAAIDTAIGVMLPTGNVQVVATAKDDTIPGSPPTVTVNVELEHRMFAFRLFEFSSLPVKSTYKSLVTTYAGKDTITFASS